MKSHNFLTITELLISLSFERPIMAASSSESSLGFDKIPNITFEEKLKAFQVKVAPLHPANVALFRCNMATCPTNPMFCWGFYIFPLVFLVGYYYLVISLVWVILLRLRVTLLRLSPNHWRLLASLPFLNHIQDISLDLEELAYQYELCLEGEIFSFIAHDRNRFLVTTIAKDEVEGWDRQMLKLIFASGDPRKSPFGFNPPSCTFFIDCRIAPEDVNMEAIEKALDFRDRS